MYSQLEQCRKVVAIGGGHGLGRLLSSLTFLKKRLVGIVATTDNGGSTGRIRDHHGGIAWGDLRNCLTQIVPTPTIASALFEYRFNGSGELAGHNLGNLILKALEDMAIRPSDAINLVRNLLEVDVGLIPMSDEPAHLTAELDNGENLFGETAIDATSQMPLTLALSPMVCATPEAIRQLRQADLILLGPGSFFTSIMPSLLIPELCQAIQQSPADLIFIDNIGKEKGIAGTLSLNDRIHRLEQSIGAGRLNGVITSNIVEPNTLPSHIHLHCQVLSSTEVYYRHDRQKLCFAIEQLLSTVRQAA